MNIIQSSINTVVGQLLDLDGNLTGKGLSPTLSPSKLGTEMTSKGENMRKLTGFLCAALAMISLGAVAAPTLINGAGSTFAAPLYSKWIAEYRSIDKSVEINYQSIGSGGGVRQFIAGTTDFGASDDPMKDDEIKQLKSPMVHIPTALGAVVITYNIPGVTQSLKLTAEVLAEIFLGKITKWDDAKIKALNPGVTLPSQMIVVAFRADGSGTTAVFTEYLAAKSPEWLAKVGKGKSVKFPTGLGGKGNEGVTGLVRQNPGAIGYIEMTYARVNNLPMASVKNKSGQFVLPSLDSVTSAASSFKAIPADLRMSVLDATGKDAYPISSYTYMLVSKKMDATKGPAFLSFLKWALDKGQDLAQTLSYAPLPKAVQEKAKQALASIK